MQYFTLHMFQLLVNLFYKNFIYMMFFIISTGLDFQSRIVDIDGQKIKLQIW